MKQISRGIVLKDRISIADIERVFDLVTLASETKSIREVIHYENEIVKTLTRVKRAGRRHRKHLVDIMTEAQLIRPDAKSNDNAKERMKEVLAFVGARIGKTPYEIAQCTPDEIPYLLREIAKRDLDNSVSMIKAYHIPDKFMKELKKAYNKLKSPIKKMISEVSTVEEIKPVNAFKAGLQPC